MEAAASLKARGLDVHVVSPDAVPFSRHWGRPPAEFSMRRTSKTASCFISAGSRRRSARPTSCSTTARRIPAQLVVMGVGVRPSLSLAEAAGLKIDRGVVVDAQLRTSDASIWAAGDAVRYVDARSNESVRIEHWVVAQRQGQLAARAMLGQIVKLDLVPFFWTTQFGVSLRYVGHAESWDGSTLRETRDRRRARSRTARPRRRLRSPSTAAIATRSSQKTHCHAVTKPRCCSSCPPPANSSRGAKASQLSLPAITTSLPPDAR